MLTVTAPKPITAPAAGAPSRVAVTPETQIAVEQLLYRQADALDGKGTIRIRTRRQGEGVVLEFEDDGPGMPPEVLSRIFEPFFTTKPVGKGTGLGLSLSHGIVARHGGTMEVTSRPGAGARFTITLPLEPPPQAEAGA